jgi:hypothetical protein
VGPTRMNYPRMVALVDQISQRLSRNGMIWPIIIRNLSSWILNQKNIIKNRR